MKKSSLLALLFFLCLNFTAEAKVLNIKANGLALLFGGMDISAHVAITSKFSLGASYAKSSSGNAEYSAIEYIGEYFFDSFSSDSWYIEAYFASATSESSVSTATADTTKYGAFIGYQWMWSYFNHTLGLGYGQYDVDSTDASFLDLSGGYPVIIWRLGLAF